MGLASTSYMLIALGGDWRRVFQVLGAWGLILAALWWLVGARASSRRALPESQSAENLEGVIKAREVWVLAGLCACSMGCYDTLLVWLSRMLRLRELSVVEAGAAASMFPLGFLLAGPVVGSLSDKVELRKPFIWALGATGAALTTLIPYLAWASLWIAVLLAGFSLSGVLTLVLAIPAEHPRYPGSSGELSD